MSKIFDVNENNDIFTVGGRLQIASGKRAVLVNCERAAKTYLGEMMYATNRGINYFSDVFSGSPNILRFEAGFRSQIKRVSGVISIDEFNAEIKSLAGDDGSIGSELVYKATIRTEFGPGEISGSVPVK
ncbi:hypothetical protein [Vibrio harveyi]|uniref:hypothetical protein n=1 Tax=Vibrio harveyi TaxID=669 RepID=UPI000C7DE728|nr:hypothetical protein [Vibrio harveyi]AWB00256.1 hypothetical protein CU052_13540 [Vibrio harveyi]HDM8061709.1 hypothetical protein [Vibrio harveyi]